MDTKAFVAVAVAVAAVAASIAAAFVLDDGKNGGPDREFTDLTGNSFALTADVGRTVVESGAALRFVSYMGDGPVGTIVGSSFEKSSQGRGPASCAYAGFPDYTELPACDTANCGEIMALEPDLVLISCPDGHLSDDQKRLIGILGDSGFPTCAVVDVDDATAGDFAEQTRLLGKVFGCKGRSKRLLNGIAAVSGDLAARSRSVAEPKNVYVGGVASGESRGFLWTDSACGCFLYLDPGKIANVAKKIDPGATGGFECGWEDIYYAQMDYGIDLAVLDVSGYRLTKEDYLSDSGRYNAVYPIKSGDFHYLLPQAGDGALHDNAMIAAYAIGRVAAPGSFGDVDVAKRSKEIYSLFLGSDERGARAYDGIASYVAETTGDHALCGEVATVTEIDEAGFDGFVGGNENVVVYFFVPWYNKHCLEASLIVYELAWELDGRVSVAKLNVYGSESMRERFSIDELPTIALIKGGVPVETMVGLKTKEDYLAALAAHGMIDPA